MENPPFWWYLPGKMGIFMGYVSLPEGNILKKKQVMEVWMVFWCFFFFVGSFQPLFFVFEIFGLRFVGTLFCQPTSGPLRGVESTSNWYLKFRSGLWLWGGRWQLVASQRIVFLGVHGIRDVFWSGNAGWKMMKYDQSYIEYIPPKPSGKIFKLLAKLMKLSFWA